MALITQHTKGTVPVDSCPCPKVGAPRKDGKNNLKVSHPANKVIGAALGKGRDYLAGLKGSTNSGRMGGHGKI